MIRMPFSPGVSRAVSGLVVESSRHEQGGTRIFLHLDPHGILFRSYTDVELESMRLWVSWGSYLIIHQVHVVIADLEVLSERGHKV